MRALILAATVSCVVCSSLLAQGTFPLGYRKVDPFTLPALGLAARAAMVKAEKPGAIVGVPAAASAAVAYYDLGLGGKPRWAAVAAGSPWELYVDADGDNDLSDEKAVPGKAGKHDVSFGVIRVLTAGGQPVEASLSAYFPEPGKPPGALTLRSAGGYTGNVELAGQTYLVALVDANFNGRYDDAFTGPAVGGGPDVIAIDYNRDGRLNQLDIGRESCEWTPLCRAVRVGGAYYRVTVPPAGSSIRLEKTEPKFGTLEFAVPHVEFAAFSDHGYVHLRTADGKARLPAGRYEPVTVILSRTDESGAAWTIRRGGYGNKPNLVEVRPDETCRLELGPPLVADTKARQHDRTVAIYLSLTGRAGGDYVGGILKDAKKVPAPGFQILDEAGKVIHTGRFDDG
jgi:hypothetical protein